MLELGILYLAINAVAVDYLFSLTEKEIHKLILEMGDSGYKLDAEKVLNLKNENSDKFQNKISSDVIMLIPGLNIKKTKSNLEKFKQNIKETFATTDVLIEMTEEEKKLYRNIKTDEVKLLYLSMISQNNDYELENNKKMVKEYTQN